MRYLRFEVNGRARYGVLEDKTVHEITPHYFGPFKKTGRKYPLAKLRILPPSEPTKIVALGLNYLDHARELKMPLPLAPAVFLKATSALVGHGDRIVYPAMSRRVDYEAELAVVIGKRAKNVPAREAMEYVLGFTCFNDVTARDLQEVDSQWARSKSFDTFAPVGPWIVDGIRPDDLKIESLVSGKVRQSSRTSELIFKIDETVAFISQIMTLYPGDIIATGTPSGIGPVRPGDTVSVRIQKIGTLTNTVAQVSGGKFIP